MGVRKIWEILYAKPYIFGNICAIIGRQNRPILLYWILMLRRFLISFPDSYSLIGRYWCNRKATYQS